MNAEKSVDGVAADADSIGYVRGLTTAARFVNRFDQPLATFDRATCVKLASALTDLARNAGERLGVTGDSAPHDAGTTWRVQWYASPYGHFPERAEGRRDFADERDARAYFASEEVQSRIGPFWRVELQQVTVTTVEGSGYLPDV